jgi:hypothetical protein
MISSVICARVYKILKHGEAIFFLELTTLASARAVPPSPPSASVAESDAFGDAVFWASLPVPLSPVISTGNAS